MISGLAKNRTLSEESRHEDDPSDHRLEFSANCGDQYERASRHIHLLHNIHMHMFWFL